MSYSVQTTHPQRVMVQSVINLSFDLTRVFAFTVSPLEMVLRGTLMYWCGRRSESVVFPPV